MRELQCSRRHCYPLLCPSSIQRRYCGACTSYDTCLGSFPHSAAAVPTRSAPSGLRVNEVAMVSVLHALQLVWRACFLQHPTLLTTMVPSQVLILWTDTNPHFCCVYYPFQDTVKTEAHDQTSSILATLLYSHLIFYKSSTRSF